MTLTRRIVGSLDAQVALVRPPRIGHLARKRHVPQARHQPPGTDVIGRRFHALGIGTIGIDAAKHLGRSSSSFFAILPHVIDLVIAEAPFVQPQPLDGIDEFACQLFAAGTAREHLLVGRIATLVRIPCAEAGHLRRQRDRIVARHGVGIRLQSQAAIVKRAQHERIGFVRRPWRERHGAIFRLGAKTVRPVGNAAARPFVRQPRGHIAPTALRLAQRQERIAGHFVGGIRDSARSHQPPRRGIDIRQTNLRQIDGTHNTRTIRRQRRHVNERKRRVARQPCDEPGARQASVPFRKRLRRADAEQSHRAVIPTFQPQVAIFKRIRRISGNKANSAKHREQAFQSSFFHVVCSIA